MRLKYQIVRHSRGSYSLHKEIDGEWTQEGLREYNPRELLGKIPLFTGDTIEIEICESED